MPKGNHPKETTTVDAWVVGAGHSTSLFIDGPIANWLGPEMLVRLKVEGWKVNAFADSGSQVNTVMLGYVSLQGCPVLPLEDLVDHPLHLVGLGVTQTHPLGFMILRVQVNEIASYDENVVFLIIPNKSDFAE